MYQGDLDERYNADRCKSIVEELTYSTEDEREKRPQNHLIPINGNIRNGSATLKQAINLYINFCEDENYFYNNHIIQIKGEPISNNAN